MDFFVVPKELGDWIGSQQIDPDVWVMAWNVHPPAISMVSRAEGTILSRYRKGDIGNNVKFFIGHRSLTDGPIIRTAEDGVKRIDFRNSLCLQVTPTFIVGDILLKGSLATLNLKEYRGAPRASQFLPWRKAVLRSFKQWVSTHSIIATQMLINGTIKEWKNVLVSVGARDWFEDGGKLKEFPEGPVEFVPKSSQNERAEASRDPRL